MSNHIRYPRIENSYRQKFIDRFVREFPELEDETFVITEKLHGRNIQVVFERTEPWRPGAWRVGKRTAFLAKDEKFAGIWDVLPIYETFFLKCQRWAHTTGMPLRLFGEFYGPGIQKGVDYGREKQIAFFGHMISDELQSFGDLMVFALLRGGLHHLVPRVAYVKGLANALAFDPEFVSELNPIEGNICEGIVIQPFGRVYVNAGGKRFLLKKKNAKFMEKASAPKPPSPGDPEVQRLNAEFKLYITDNRLQNVFSKHGKIESREQIGDYIRLMIADAKEDFIQDHGDAFNKLDKGEQGKVTNVGRIVADMLKRCL